MVRLRMDTFKCLEAKLPRAITATFKTKVSQSGDRLQMKNELRKDHEHPYLDGEAYLAVGAGDSGSPFWIDSFDNDQKYRKTVVAVLEASHGMLYDPLYGYDPSVTRICRTYATKLTEEIIKWIKEKSGIH